MRPFERVFIQDLPTEEVASGEDFVVVKTALILGYAL